MNKILILFPSWEERSFLGLAKIVRSRQINVIYVIEKLDSLNKQETENSLKKIKEFSQSNNIIINTINLDNELFSTFETIGKSIESIEPNDKITIDITTMSRNIIWSLLFFLKQHFSKVDIVYNSPFDYSNEWISREPSKPRLLFKHSGIINLELKNCLVIVTGFDADRTKQLARYYDPQKIILLIQDGNKFNNSLRNKSDIHKQMCEELGYTNIDILNIDAYSSDLGYSIIEDVISKNIQDYNIILASLGPKLSAISIYKAYICHPEIALSYVPCNEYNINYCTGIGSTYECSFDLECLVD